jgi:hypothetical protein
LEEGTGYPARLLVVADVEGILTLCAGAVFMPFEFTVPMAWRLTDETARGRLRTSKFTFRP